ncbi:MAG TPA: ribonuclease P protein component [Candidatus Aquilonibacter sp.]|nr:ribonuclease P protein component [Candidatus Aquilonibacter sp.]
MPAKNTARFPRSARLLRHADFERVYKLGKRHFSTSMTVFYLARQEEATQNRESAELASTPSGGMRIGFTVSRALGGAVQRNRMKRRLREAVRLGYRAVDVPADVVINPRKSLLSAAFADVMNEVSRAFVVIEEKLGRRSGTTGDRRPGAASGRISKKPETNE